MYADKRSHFFGLIMAALIEEVSGGDESIQDVMHRADLIARDMEKFDDERFMRERSERIMSRRKGREDVDE